MFHSRKLINRISNILERALRIIFRDCESTFHQLLKQNNSASMHRRKYKIKNWETDNCPCRLCKPYIQRVGFI